MMSLRGLNRLTEDWTSTSKMPLLFIGHGNPMNAIEDNAFSNGWKKLAEEIPAPKAILCISAHWLTRGTWVTGMDKPKTIHDFSGFPQALFNVQYPCEGSQVHAKEIQELVTNTKVELDNEWGIDHGTWSVLNQMYPKADIPVLQLSIDYYKPPQYHYDLAKQLSSLRKKGVLIIGSGNIVHNLQLARMGDDVPPFDWAIEFDEKIKAFLESNNHQGIIDYQKLGEAAKLSVPTPDHYFPLLYTIAMQEDSEKLSFPIEGMAFGSGSMRSVRIG